MNRKQNTINGVEILLALTLLGCGIVYPDSLWQVAGLLAIAYVTRVYKGRKNLEYSKFLEAILSHNCGNHEAVYLYLKKIDKQIKKNFSFYRQLLEPMYIRDFISESYNCNKIIAVAKIARSIENDTILGYQGKRVARYALASIGDYISREAWIKECYHGPNDLEISVADRQMKAVSYILFIINNKPRPNAWLEFADRENEKYRRAEEYKNKTGQELAKTLNEALEK